MVDQAKVGEVKIPLIKSDDYNLIMKLDGLLVVTNGSVRLRAIGYPDFLAFPAVKAGRILRYPVNRVAVTGTTASVLGLIDGGRYARRFIYHNGIITLAGDDLVMTASGEDIFMTQG